MIASLNISGLRIDVASTGDDIVDEIDLSIAPGEVLGLVGESGSGKTTVGLSELGHVRRGVRLAQGTITIGTTSMLELNPAELRRARGQLVSYVPQDPSSSLNPALRIETQLLEVMQFHDFGGTDDVRRRRLLEVLTEVRLPDAPEFLRRYPHQLSGGQQQRVGLAMAFACRPSVIVLDEPTTGLDVTTQAHVLDTVRDLTRRHGVAALYVTHDLSVVANLADRVAVMYSGRVVELGPTSAIFGNPEHPYTRSLRAAVPDIVNDRRIIGVRGRAPAPGARPVGCAFAARCEAAMNTCRESAPEVTTTTPGHTVRCFRAGVELVQRDGLRAPSSASSTTDTVLSVRKLTASHNGLRVLHDVDLEVRRGECLALVGESGSGKSTLSRSIGGLHREWTGEILVNGSAMARAARDRPTKQRLAVQYIFQNPYDSLHPRRTVGESAARPLRIAGVSARAADQRVAQMFDRVSLPPAYVRRYPDQLSGGERQRVAIARALVSNPGLLICDEITSSLDVLVQAAVIELLADLQRELGLTILFVTHNLALVRSVAQHVAVIANGRIVEFGTTDSVFTEPTAEYTRRLLADTPSIVAIPPRAT